MNSSVNIPSLIENMTDGIASLGLPEPLLIGIHTGGAWVAEKIHSRLQPADSLGTIDISFYRDDFSRVGLNPEVRASSLPVSIEDRHIVLIDDVLYTGRTIRAAMNEIFSYGRPASVKLGVLIERPGRELPIQADITGCSLDLGVHEQAKLRRENDELILNIISTGNST